MRRIVICLLVVLLCPAASALAGLDVKMAGDLRVYGIFFQNRNFTGWNATGTATEDTLQIYQRFRIRTDFITSDDLKFRLGFMVTDTAWGTGTYTADAAQVSIQVYQAYLQFKWPDTKIQFTVGLQPLSLPQSPVFYDSVVLASKKETKSTAGIVITAPLIEDTLALNLGFIRRTDAGAFDATTTQAADELDLYFLTLPITLDGFDITPWAMAGVIGQGASLSSSVRAGLRSGGSYLTPTGYQDSQNLGLWAGASVVIDALDPIVFQADAIYGQTAMGDAARNRRHGSFFDAAVQYTGLSFVTPEIGVWWSSGEDSDLTNGSERIPVISPNFGMANSFLFPCNQDFSNDNMGIDVTGSMGATLAFENLSFFEKLSHIISLTAMTGTSSPRGMRLAVAASGGNGNYLTMGKTLAEGEWLLGLTFDSKYMIYENLALTLETGWANLSGAKASIWNTPRNYTRMINDAWKVALGFKYTF
ncbi:outer membrane homotrimeric porin [Desulfolutivibrio sp.]|uniref:outer membrane homotrimeric porin n=1 Tax=Desulfolutivibrio sp. TaxID=2773296 RepID=UPI002F9635AC